MSKVDLLGKPSSIPTTACLVFDLFSHQLSERIWNEAGVGPGGSAYWWQPCNWPTSPQSPCLATWTKEGAFISSISAPGISFRAFTIHQNCDGLCFSVPLTSMLSLGNRNSVCFTLSCISSTWHSVDAVSSCGMDDCIPTLAGSTWGQWVPTESSSNLPVQSLIPGTRTEWKMPGLKFTLFVLAG